MAQYFVANVLPDVPWDMSVSRSVLQWREQRAKEALTGLAPERLPDEWDDKKIPRKYYGTLNGRALAMPAPVPLPKVRASSAELEA